MENGGASRLSWDERFGLSWEKSLFLRPGMLAALGLIAGHLLVRSGSFTAWQLGAAAAFAGLAGVLLCRSRGILFTASFCFAFTGLGGFQESLLVQRDFSSNVILENLSEGASPYAAATGKLEGFPKRSASSWTLFLDEGAVVGIRGETVELPSRVAVRVRAVDEVEELVGRLVPGDVIRLGGVLEELPRFGASGEANGWLRSRGASALIRAKKIEVLESPEARGYFQQFAALSQNARRSAEASFQRRLSRENAALLSAMALGRTHHLTPDQRRQFQRAGLMHLFAVSGLHTMLVGGLAIWFLRLLGMRPGWRLLILVAILLFFACLVGMRSSVLRAAALLTLFEARELLRRPIDSMAALGTVSSAMMILSPRALWQVDFQMSFLCATAIVLMAPWMFDLQRALGRRFGWAFSSRLLIRSAQIFCVSAGIQIFLAPVLIGTFNEASLVAPAANMFMLPLATLSLWLAFPAMVLSLGLPFAGGILLEVTGIPLTLLRFGTNIFGEWEFASIQSIPWPAWVVALYYLLLFTAPWMRFRWQSQPRRVAWQFAPGMVAIAAFFVWLPLFGLPNGELDIWFLDVGQGDAVLIREPGGKAALIDSGPQQAAWILPSMLRKRGIDRLDVLVASHADADHIGAMSELIEEMPVERLLVGGSLSDSAQFLELAEAVRSRHLPVTRIQRGAVLSLGEEVELTTLHPSPDYVREGADRNQASVVLRLDYAGTSVLLTGDAEENAETAMLDSGYDLDIDILKAGHHGSDDSSGVLFLKGTTPDVAVISCGANNRYGHPAPELLARFARESVGVFRTDRQGTIHLEISQGGERVWHTTRTYRDGNQERSSDVVAAGSPEASSGRGQ